MKIGELKARTEEYFTELQDSEKARNTVKSYRADLKALFEYLDAAGRTDGGEISRADIVSYKDSLRAAGTATATINRKIVSINRFLKWAGAVDAVGTKQIKIQEKSTLENVISKADYERLLKVALNPPPQAVKAGLKPDPQVWAMLVTIANTGVRFDELQYFTVEAIQAARKSKCITVENKGKQRTIPIGKGLNKVLSDYCKSRGIESGVIFCTRNGTPISNPQFSRRLKKIAGYARINKTKVHPHNFRHLFAKEFMQDVGRIDQLQGILGHSSIKTTSIYTRTTAKELATNTEKLDLLP